MSYKRTHTTKADRMRRDQATYNFLNDLCIVERQKWPKKNYPISSVSELEKSCSGLFAELKPRNFKRKESDSSNIKKPFTRVRKP